MERSISQLLSVRREHNCTKLDVEELKHLWDITVAFIQVLNITGMSYPPPPRSDPTRPAGVCRV